MIERQLFMAMGIGGANHHGLVFLITLDEGTSGYFSGKHLEWRIGCNMIREGTSFEHTSGRRERERHWEEQRGVTNGSRRSRMVRVQFQNQWRNYSVEELNQMRQRLGC